MRKIKIRGGIPDLIDVEKAIKETSITTIWGIVCFYVELVDGFECMGTHKLEDGDELKDGINKAEERAKKQALAHLKSINIDRKSSE